MRVQPAKAVAVALLGLFGAVALYLSLRGREVPVATPERSELVQSLVVTGRVLAPAQIGLGALTSGNVAELLVDEGDRVRRGDLLLRLDDAEQQAALAQAEAALQEAIARRESLRTVGLPRARAALAQAEADLVQAERQWERTERLHRQGALSDAALDDARRRLETARAARGQAAAAAQGAAPGGADARVADAAVANAEAAVRLARTRLDRTRIEAPTDGVVLRRQVELGDAVQPGQVLLVLAAAGPTEIEVEPDERNLGLLQVGQKARVSADAFPDRVFEAEIRRIAPAVDERRGTVSVRLSIPEPPPYLRPDMTVSADIEVARRADALVVPVSAVRDLGTGAPWVLVVEGGRAVRRNVRIGLRGRHHVEILEGIAEGTPVVDAPDVEPGQRVVAAGRR